MLNRRIRSNYLANLHVRPIVFRGDELGNEQLPPSSYGQSGVTRRLRCRWKT